jgi:hypothetical protein
MDGSWMHDVEWDKSSSERHIRHLEPTPLLVTVFTFFLFVILATTSVMYYSHMWFILANLCLPKYYLSQDFRVTLLSPLAGFHCS